MALFKLFLALLDDDGFFHSFISHSLVIWLSKYFDMECIIDDGNNDAWC